MMSDQASLFKVGNILKRDSGQFIIYRKVEVVHETSIEGACIIVDENVYYRSRSRAGLGSQLFYMEEGTTLASEDEFNVMKNLALDREE